LSSQSCRVKIRWLVGSDGGHGEPHTEIRSRPGELFASQSDNWKVGNGGFDSRRYRFTEERIRMEGDKYTLGPNYGTFQPQVDKVLEALTTICEIGPQAVVEVAMVMAIKNAGERGMSTRDAGMIGGFVNERLTALLYIRHAMLGNIDFIVDGDAVGFAKNDHTEAALHKLIKEYAAQRAEAN
jgi:hypothetical protein